MTRRWLSTICALLAAACGGPDAPAANATDQRPNILFILTDDQRADSVGFMGNSVVQTPHLDRLAAEGQVFEQAFVTSAICTPSRACYFLGQYERRHGINFNSGSSMSREAWSRSYPALLRQHGYVTGYVGKNHVPVGEKGYFSGVVEDTFDYWYAGHHHLAFYSKEWHEIFDNARADTQVEIVTEGALGFLDPDSNEAFLTNAVRFLARRPTDQPFCLSVALNVPHGFATGRMQSRPSDDDIYRTLYRDRQDSPPLPETYVARADIRAPKLPPDVLLTELRQTGYDYVDRPETLRERMVREYQAITGIDRMVGVLRDQLARLGLAENTVIVFTSDHGIFNGEHGLGGKSLCYETCMQVPFVVYDPRLPASHRGLRRRELILSIDVAPTLLGLAGIEIPESMQGSDLRPLLRGEQVPWRKAAFGENLWSNIFGNPRCETVRTDEYRYIRYFRNDNAALRARTPADQLYEVNRETKDNYRRSLTSSLLGEEPVYEELFHVPGDPHWRRNLVDDAAHAAALSDMRALCRALVAEAKGDAGTPPSTIDIEMKWQRPAYRKR